MTDQPVPVPTQVRRPWRATLRTVLQALVSFAALAPFIAAAVEDATGYDLDGVPFVVTALLVCAGFTRVMALPAVEAFLQRFVPFLAATPRTILGKAIASPLPPTVEKPGGMRARRTDEGDVRTLYVLQILGVVALIVVLLAFVGAL